ncbi:MAG: hypothetical protein ACPF9D_07860 [Owenweeksia sp.]
MKKFFLLLGFLMLGLTNRAGAHAVVENMWMFYPAVNGQNWNLNINVPTHHFHELMILNYPELEGKDMNGTEFRKKVFFLLKREVQISFNGEKIRFEGVDINFGGHDGTVRLLIPDVPSKPEQLYIELNGLSRSYHVDNRFFVYVNHETFTERLEHNSGTLTFNFEDGIFAIEGEQKVSAFAGISQPAYYVIAVWLLAAIVFLVRK